jgi:tetratricopeptide (TPR) repeat protein
MVEIWREMAWQAKDGLDPSRPAAGAPHAGCPPWEQSPRLGSWWATLLAASLIALALVAAYWNSFDGALIFDDDVAISSNSTIRQLWPMGRVLQPPRNGEPVSGRPLLNLSLAVNYALAAHYAKNGTAVWGYHAVNLAIHILDALLLFGILRRTLTIVDGGRWTVNGGGTAKGENEFAGEAVSHAPSTVHGPPSTLLALAITLLWALHPLQTESVTYIVQRAESGVALFYLLVLYSVIRGATAAKGILWYVAAVLACLLGMATKEVMATAPLVVLLYDRAFLAGSLVQTLRRRWGLYLSLAATWGLLIYLVYSTGLWGTSAGYGAPEAVDSWDYLRSQPLIILHYLRLCVWPHPLCLDYGRHAFATSLGALLPAAIVVGLLLSLTAWGLAARKGWAFLGGWLFLILSPSSLIPLSDMAFEHRMYLPLAAVVTAIVLGAYFAAAALTRRGMIPLWAAQIGGSCLVLGACLFLAILTARRNTEYRDPLAMWEDTITKSPRNHRAHNNLGAVLFNQQRLDEAIAEYRKSVDLSPDYAKAYNNLGAALFQQGRSAEAIGPCRRAVALAPQLAEPHYNFGNALGETGQIDDAIAQYEVSLHINPFNARANNNLANALARLGRLDEAIAHYRQALQIDPQMLEAHFNLGNACYREGDLSTAVRQWYEAIRLQPDAIPILNQTARVLATCNDAAGRNGAKAVELAERAAGLTARRDPAILDTLAAAYAEAGRFSAAIETARQALGLASAQSNGPLADQIRERLDLYRNAKPYRTP